MRLNPVPFLVLVLPALAGNPPEWSKPAPPFHIAGPVYSVGTAELGCYLIRGSVGDILINTGLAGSAPMIAANIRALGFDPKAIRIQLTNQAHFDHAGGFAAMRRLTGAQVYATAGDAPLLEDGGASDPGGLGRFEPVKVDRVLKDGEVIRLGDLALKVISTPGHTPGSVSYEMTVREAGQDRVMFFANLPTVVMPLKTPKYPGIVADLRSSFTRLKALRPDIWVAAHVSQCGLDAKHKAGQFEDPCGYAKAVADCEADFLAKEKAELGP
jgi:metallo-beta-lactamase class B